MSRGADGQLVGLDDQASNPSSGIASGTGEGQNFPGRENQAFVGNTLDGENGGALIGGQGDSFSRGGGQVGGSREVGDRGFVTGGSFTKQIKYKMFMKIFVS